MQPLVARFASGSFSLTGAIFTSAFPVARARSGRTSSLLDDKPTVMRPTSSPYAETHFRFRCSSNAKTL